jgi:Zn2+/Cd2+-exporting ATPase
MSESNAKQTYRVEGFTCANCAAKFENNVQNLEGVEDAKVNFGASKLTVYGNTTIESLEKAGAFEGLKLREDRDKQFVKRDSFLKRNMYVLLACILVVFAYVSQTINGEDSLWTIAIFFSAIAIGGFRLFKTGLLNLIRLEFDMRTLMTIAIIGAAIIGEWGEGAIVVILFAISERLEAYSMDKARESIRSLIDLAPSEALIERDGKEQLIEVEDIQIGDVMIVKPGQKIAMDGQVESGLSSVNQAAITGESVPVEKSLGDDVFAGTLNAEGYLKVRVTKRVEDTTLAKITHLVEEAQGEKAPSQAFVDRFAKYYTPIIIGIAFLVALIPPLVMGLEWSTWIYQGLAVLVVGCPCALVISTPVSIVTAIGNAASKGVLIKGGVYLEELGQLKAIAFDKTGTLTKGTPEVTDFILLESLDEKEVWSKIAALEFYSQHPLAAALVRKAEENNIDFRNISITNFLSHTGKGISGDIDGAEYFIGNEKLFDAVPQQKIKDLQLNGKTVMVFGKENHPLALIGVADEARETSRNVIEELHRLGIKQTIMLTGDNEATGEAIAAKLKVKDIKASLLPEQKLDFIKSYQKKYGKVAMVGDGVNDAPALAAATVGVAMGGAGTDTALETADIALMSDDLEKLPFIVTLSRKALTVIKQNITFAIGIKIIALLLVVPGWLTLWIAIFADMGATLIVTLNGLRLLRVKQ